MSTPASAPANILYHGFVQPQQSLEATLDLIMQQYQLQTTFGECMVTRWKSVSLHLKNLDSVQKVLNVH